MQTLFGSNQAFIQNKGFMQVKDFERILNIDLRLSSVDAEFIAAVFTEKRTN